MKFPAIYRMLAVVAVLGSSIFVTNCGGSSSTANPNSVTGQWTVTLFDSTNQEAYVFTTSLNQQVASPAISSPITGSNLNVTKTDPAKACFSAGADAKQSGIYTVSDNFNGLTAATVQLTVQGNPGTINMKGTFTTNAISGPWSLAKTPGSPDSCVVSGTFLMTRM